VRKFGGDFVATTMHRDLSAFKELEDFKISHAIIDPKRTGDTYEIIKLAKKLDIKEESYGKIIDELGNLISEEPVLGGTAIRVVGGKSNGKSFVGVFVGEEGYYSGMPKNLHIRKTTRMLRKY
jgi:hypothetical protein